ncbi:MAG: VCBS repeat-containing protein [Deltaproteobacteria bacterium]|nr:VCBS repeat-containing protein [Deltaproteobacteria bacterium]
MMEHTIKSQKKRLVQWRHLADIPLYLFRYLSEQAQRLLLLRLLFNRTVMVRTLLTGLLLTNLKLTPVLAEGYIFIPHNPLAGKSLDWYSHPTLVDIDSDGDLDVLVGELNGSLKFFKNVGTIHNPILSYAGNLGVQNWYGKESAPSLADIDGDGDLDLFMGDRYGDTYFFENIGGAYNPTFGPKQYNAFGLSDVEGSSHPTLVDIDHDGDQDIFIGSYEGILYFENMGNVNTPNFGPPQTNPFGLTGVDPTFVDINADGDLDAFIGDNSGNTLYFENIGTNNSPAYGAAQINPFGLIDVGGDSSPTFGDIDNDGDFDAFIGDKGGDDIYFENTGNATTPNFSPDNPFGLITADGSSRLTFVDIDDDHDLDTFVGDDNGDILYLENTGSAITPTFGLTQTNPFSLTKVSEKSSPTFVDIDNDNDFDAFIGESTGNTLYFENIGSKNNPAFGLVQTNPFSLTFVYENSKPSFVDIDGDGDLDAFIKGLNDDTFYQTNTGTPQNPAFDPTVQINPFNLEPVIGSSHFSFVDFDGDGDFDAFMGKTYAILYYRNNGDIQNPSFDAAKSNPFGLMDVSFRNSLTVVDINGDGNLDVFVDGYRRHASFLKGIALPFSTYLPTVYKNN